MQHAICSQIKLRSNNCSMIHNREIQGSSEEFNPQNIGKSEVIDGVTAISWTVDDVSCKFSGGQNYGETR